MTTLKQIFNEHSMKFTLSFDEKHQPNLSYAFAITASLSFTFLSFINNRL